jgi:hypothetical protein
MLGATPLLLSRLMTQPLAGSSLHTHMCCKWPAPQTAPRPGWARAGMCWYCCCARWSSRHPASRRWALGVARGAGEAGKSGTNTLACYNKVMLWQQHSDFLTGWSWVIHGSGTSIVLPVGAVQPLTQCCTSDSILADHMLGSVSHFVLTHACQYLRRSRGAGLGRDGASAIERCNVHAVLWCVQGA